MPSEPEYYSVVFRTDSDRGYCVDEENAKALLKNHALQSGYTEEMKSIIMNLKKGNE